MLSQEKQRLGGDRPAASVGTGILTAYLPSREEIVGHDRALNSDHQPHGNTLGFVVMCLVQDVHGTNGGAEAQGRSSGLSDRSTSDKGTHDWVRFAVALLEAPLGADRVGGNQAGK